MQRRPTSVTVFAIIDIVLAVLGVLAGVWYLVSLLGLGPQADPAHNPTAQLMESNAAYRWFTHVSNVLGFITTIALLCGAIGMLQLRPWARVTVIGWCVYAIVVVIIASVLNHVLLLMPMLEKAQGPERIGMQVAIAITFAIMLLYVLFAAWQLFALTRPKVVAAFTAPQPEVI